MEKELSTFQDSFSKQQKGAIITALSIISITKGFAHQNEVEDLIETSKTLGIDLDDKVIEHIQSSGHQYLLDILKTLSIGQKEWLIVAFHSMAMAKGNGTEEEGAVIMKICNSIGISDEMYIETIEKFANVMKRF
jgi:uncharacterized tellurite resistance protein B-like protein